MNEVLDSEASKHLVAMRTRNLASARASLASLAPMTAPVGLAVRDDI